MLEIEQSICKLQSAASNLQIFKRSLKDVPLDDNDRAVFLNLIKSVRLHCPHIESLHSSSRPVAPRSLPFFAIIAFKYAYTKLTEATRSGLFSEYFRHYFFEFICDDDAVSEKLGELIIEASLLNYLLCFLKHFQLAFADAYIRDGASPDEKEYLLTDALNCFLKLKIGGDLSTLAHEMQRILRSCYDKGLNRSGGSNFFPMDSSVERQIENFVARLENDELFTAQIQVELEDASLPPALAPRTGSR